MAIWRRASEGLARKTSRRGFFGKGVDVAFGALAGVAAGTVTRAGSAMAGAVTLCEMPGPPCACEHCIRMNKAATGVCAKPCVISLIGYASGCWVTEGTVTCCDCECGDGSLCGCGSDYHNDPHNCP